MTQTLDELGIKVVSPDGVEINTRSQAYRYFTTDELRAACDAADQLGREQRMEHALEKLRAFAIAADKLSMAWRELSNDDDIQLGDHYPLAGSFDQVAADIREWSRHQHRHQDQQDHGTPAG